MGTAAYWAHTAATASPPTSFRLGGSLAEEVTACLLGGYGIPAFVSDAMWQRVRLSDALTPDMRATQREALLLDLLTTPLNIAGRTVRYRFPNQRTARISAALHRLHSAANVPTGSRPLRDWLATLPGVGLKTASWVVRNHLGADDVVIVDVHIRRAGTVAGVFDPGWRPDRDYAAFETAFLAWAAFGRVSAALLDTCIWGVLARSRALRRAVLGDDPHPAAIWAV